MGLLKSFTRTLLGSVPVVGAPLVGLADSVKVRRKTDVGFTGYHTSSETTYYGAKGGADTQQPKYPVPVPGAPGAEMYAGKGMAVCPVGYRLNRSTYITRGGGTSHWPRQIIVHPKGSTCVRRRRMNVGNARALRRALRRARGFAKLSRRAHRVLAGFARQGVRGGRSRRALPASVEVVRTG